MALASAPAVSLPRRLRPPAWRGGVVVVSTCLVAIALLVPPAVAAADPIADSAPVSVRLVGQVSVAGLPARAAISRLSVRNDGAAAISWSARTSISGPGAAGVRVETWLPGGQPCTASTHLLTASSWSKDSILPGGSIDLCVRVTASGTSWGTAAPTLTLAARPATV
jgi:hypothetical protein